MGLKQLLTNLEAGTIADIVDSQPFYTNYNNGGSDIGNSVSLFDSPTDLFKNKSFKFGQGRAFDRPNNGFSEEPFITKEIQSTISEEQSLLDTFNIPRGGISFATDRAQTDKKRIKKLFETNKGRAFRIKQTGLQLMNPKIVSDAKFIEKGQSLFDALGDLLDNGGPLLYNNANRTYNPLGTNTTKQIANNHLGLHFDKSGFLPINAINNPKSNYEAVAKITDRLNALRGEHIVDNSKPLQSFAPKNVKFSFGKKLIGFVVDTAKNVLGLSDSILYEYKHGPNSLLGIGRTTIRKFQNSKINTKFRGDLNGDLDNEYTLTLNTEEGYLPFSTPDTLNSERGVGVSLFGDKENAIRESNMSMGNPGVLTGDGGLRLTKKRDLAYNQVIDAAIDKINSSNTIEYDYDNNLPTEDPTLKDFIKFYFDVYTDDVKGRKTSRIQFRAFLESFGDNYNGDWNEFNYAGRAEPFYTYKSFKRSIDFSFKIAAQTRSEIIPLYKKLNYLVSTTAPTYSNIDDDNSGRMRGTFIKATIGDLLDNVPGFFSTIALSWSKEYPWEIKLDNTKNGMDKDVYQNPHVLDVKCSFTPIHNFIPQTSINDSRFIIPLEDPGASPLQTGTDDQSQGGVRADEFGFDPNDPNDFANF